MSQMKTKLKYLCIYLFFSFPIYCYGGDDWNFSQEKDKMTDEIISTASGQLYDKKYPDAVVDVEIKCEMPNEFLSMSITTFSKKSGKKDYEALKLDRTRQDLTIDGKIFAINARSGENKFSIGIGSFAPIRYSNYIEFGLNFNWAMKETIKATGIKQFKEQQQQFIESVSKEINRDSGGKLNFPKEINQQLTNKLLLLQIPTIDGTPVISIDLSNKEIKKVFSICNVVPEYGKVSIDKLQQSENQSTEIIKGTKINESDEKKQSKLPQCQGTNSDTWNMCVGTKNFSSDVRYSGEWKNGTYHGHGISTYPNSKYDGQYREGNRDGFGVLIYSDGKKYVGEFKDGKFNGQGTFTFVDGKTQNGIWKDGVLYK